MLVATVILSTGIALVPFAKWPVEGLRWQAYAGVYEVLVNGGFENGPGVGWTESFSHGQELITAELPHTGQFSADECGINQCTDWIQQQITIPSNGRLTYWWYMTTQESGSPNGSPDRDRERDFLKVQVFSTTGQLLATVKQHGNRDTRNRWTMDSISLGAGAGRMVLLRFTTTTDSERPTEFYIDDVSVQ
jgi:hypothetical protein